MVFLAKKRVISGTKRGPGTGVRRPGEQYSQPGHVRAGRLYPNTRFFEYPVGVNFGISDIPSGLTCAGAVALMVHMWYPGWWCGGVVPG